MLALGGLVSRYTDKVLSRIRVLDLVSGSGRELHPSPCLEILGCHKRFRTDVIL